MKEEAGVKLSQTLYARAEKIWPRYLCHPFVTQMADGTLPPEKSGIICFRIIYTSRIM